MLCDQRLIRIAESGYFALENARSIRCLVRPLPERAEETLYSPAAGTTPSTLEVYTSYWIRGSIIPPFGLR